MVEGRIRAARFPDVKSLDTFDFPAIPAVNRALELVRCGYIQRRENVIAVGNSGAGKTYVALGLGLAACQRGMSLGFTASALVLELMEARGERLLLNLQRQLSRRNLLIVDELGFVPLSRTGAGLLFEVFSQRYERGSILVTANLPFDEWAGVFRPEHLTGALVILSANRMPQLNLLDDQVADRLRVITYVLPERMDKSIKDGVQKDKTAAEAMLAKLVDHAPRNPPGQNCR